MKPSPSITMLLATVGLVAGCATARFDAEKTHSVKRLAILAIEIQQQQPKDALGIKKMKEFKTRIGDSAELQEMAKNVYTDFSSQIERKTGWKVLSLNVMQSNPVYAQKVKSAMEGARLTSMPAGENYEIVALKGELDAFAFRKMSHEERAKLARALGVDAFAYLQIYMPIDQGWSIGNISGDARFSFQARSNMDVYDLQSDKPIWRIQNVDGEATAKSDTLDKSLPVRARLARLGQQAASSSISKLLSSYK